MYLNAARRDALSRLMSLLAEDYAEREIRERVGHSLMAMLGADYFASYVWSDERQRFEGRVSIHMDDSNLSAYETYFQYRDPITPRLQQRRVPTLVTQVLAQPQLERTEFFNDFLARDGLCWGVNLYAYQGERNIGDLRIWRARQRGNFERDALALLGLIQPAFTQALQRARARQPAADDRRLSSTHWEGPALTEREREIARLVCEGVSDKAVARALGIEFSTVRTHLQRMFEKLGVHSRGQLQARLLGRPDA